MVTHSKKCIIRTLPIEILRSIFKILNAGPSHLYERPDILNATKTCKALYSVGLPYLYHDVIIQKYSRSESFFEALPRNGRFVRRLRIEEECIDSRDYDDGYVHYFCNKHNLNSEKFAAIARYCTDLQVLYVGWSHFREWNPSVLKLFTGQRTTLQTVVLPTIGMTDSGHSVLRFYATLSRLRELRLTSQYMADPLIFAIARSCTELRDIYLYRCHIFSVEKFLAFLELIPNLEILHLLGEQNEDLINDNVSISSFVPDLLSKLPLQNRKLCTLILQNVFISRIPYITPQSFPNLRVLDISWRAGESPEKIENLVNFLESLENLQFLHIDDRDMFLADSNDVLVNFIPRTIKVFVHHNQFYRPESILHNLIREGALFSKGLFHNTVEPSPWDGLERDVFIDDWEYKFR
jgi:F-box-like